MSSTASVGTTAAPTGPPTGDPGGLNRLMEQETRYWYLLAGICILTTAGLVFAIAPLLSERMAGVWPWANTTVVLLTLLPLATALLAGYLTMQRHKARQTRRQVQDIVESAGRRERQNAARLRAVLNISRMMGSITNLESVFQTITSTCLDVFDCQQASLMLLSEDKQFLETRAANGHKNLDDVRKTRVKLGEGIAGYVAAKREPIILTADTKPGDYPSLRLNDKNLSAAMVVPILLRDELVGVLNISSREPDASYSTEDLQSLRVFAESAGTCIRHTEHVEWMRKTIQEQSQRKTAGQPAQQADAADPA